MNRGMLKKIFLTLFVLSLGLASGEALARGRSGDMFEDADWCCGHRPWVKSDLARGQDMFAAIPLTYHANADLFDGMRPTRIATNEDMLAPRPVLAWPISKPFQPWADR